MGELCLKLFQLPRRPSPIGFGLPLLITKALLDVHMQSVKYPSRKFHEWAA